MKNLMQMMAEIEPGFLTGACCFLDVLRVKAGMSHDKFNQAVMGLADSGTVYLEKHAHPAQLSESEKRNYVTVGENTFIVAVVRKNREPVKRIIGAMMQIEPGAMNQVPVWIPNIRKLAGMSHDDFDKAMFTLAESEIIYMDRHAHPGQVTAQERDEFLIDNLGQVFVVAIFRKDAAEKIAALDEAVDRMPVEPDQAQTDEPVRKPGKGGKRPGAGRKTGTRVVSDSEKRVKLNGVRVPAWLNDWLKSRGMAGELITQALIRQHGLTPPV